MWTWNRISPSFWILIDLLIKLVILFWLLFNLGGFFCARLLEKVDSFIIWVYFLLTLSHIAVVDLFNKWELDTADHVLFGCFLHVLILLRAFIMSWSWPLPLGFSWEALISLSRRSPRTPRTRAHWVYTVARARDATICWWSADVLCLWLGWLFEWVLC